MLDALIVVARLPRGVCIMKAELLRNIFLGAGARLARYIRNDSGRRMVRDAVTSLKEGGAARALPGGHAHRARCRSTTSSRASP